VTSPFWEYTEEEVSEIESQLEELEVLSFADGDAGEEMGILCARKAPVALTHSYSTDLATLPRARADLREACAHRHDVPLDSLALVASEFLSNAIRYGVQCSRKGPLEMRLRVTDEVARLEVLNEGKPFRFPVSVPPAPSSQSGRGLYLVSKLADRWGEELTPQKQVLVWSEFDLHRAHKL